MYLEQEVYLLLVLAFGAVSGVSAIVLVIFLIKSHNRNILWFGGQIVFLSFAFYLFFKCIVYLPNQGDAMYSENQSITLALSGVCWAISMVLNLIGIYKMLKKADIIYGI